MEQDKVVQELFKVVQDKKASIAKAEKPNWITNCSFRYNKESSTATNLQVCNDVQELVQILGFLIEKKNAFDSAKKIIGISTDFKWCGYTLEDWSSDIKTRVDKIEITKKKQELEMLESRLDKLVSPEMRQQMELDEIKKLLNM